MITASRQAWLQHTADSNTDKYFEEHYQIMAQAAGLNLFQASHKKRSRLTCDSTVFSLQDSELLSQPLQPLTHLQNNEDTV